MDSQEILKFEDLSFSYEMDPVLRNVSLCFRSKEKVGILGPNGSGKSTLLKLLSGILENTGKVLGGTVSFQGNLLESFPLEERVKKIGYLGSFWQSEFPLRVEESIFFGICANGDASLQSAFSKKVQKRIAEVMDECACSHLTGRSLHSLSGGERQMVGMARMLAQDPDVFLLDESFSQMDLDYQYLMGNLIQKLSLKGKLIVFISHDVNQVSAWADKAVLLKEGMVLAEGLVSEVFNEKNFEILYPAAKLSFWKEGRAERPKVFLA
jgi:iron complex transport system ATP-binding protein